MVNFLKPLLFILSTGANNSGGCCLFERLNLLSLLGESVALPVPIVGEVELASLP